MRRRLSGAPAVPFLKSYIVFNVEQIAGLPEHYYAKPGAKRPETQRIEHAEPIFRGDEGRHPPRRPTGLLFADGGFHRCKVRGHRAIAPFSGVGRIVLTGTLRG